MHKSWDRDKGGRDQWIAWLAGILAECRRVVKPGGYALVWALPRTSHWAALALEEAGWTIRDSVAHLFGSGFPKSHSCLKPAHEVWWLAKAPGPLVPLHIDACRVPTGDSLNGGAYSAGKHDDGQWGTMHAFTGKEYAQPAGRWPPNLVMTHHPDCQPAGVRRVRGHTGYPHGPGGSSCQFSQKGTHTTRTEAWAGYADASGYEEVQAWQCHPSCPIRLLDEQAGPRTTGAMKAGTRRANTCGYRGAMPDHTLRDTYGDTGCASRFFRAFAPDPADAVPFFYCAKASRAERNRGLDGLPARKRNATAFDGAGGVAERIGEDGRRTPQAIPAPEQNCHPTVKSVALMQWLCRLVCPPGGLVLDPFCGSGSTLVACVQQGMRCIGIDECADYVEIARRRIAAVQPALPLALAGEESR